MSFVSLQTFSGIVLRILWPFFVNQRGPKWQFNSVKSSIIVTFIYCDKFIWSQQCHNNSEGLYFRCHIPQFLNSRAQSRLSHDCDRPTNEDDDARAVFSRLSERFCTPNKSWRIEITDHEKATRHFSSNWDFAGARGSSHATSRRFHWWTDGPVVTRVISFFPCLIRFLLFVLGKRQLATPPSSSWLWVLTSKAVQWTVKDITFLTPIHLPTLPVLITSLLSAIDSPCTFRSEEKRFLVKCN